MLDTAAAIEGAVTDTSAGVLADATTVAANDGLVLNLTIAEYKQIADNTTLTTGYDVSDLADNIEAEISADGTSLGALTGAQSVTSTDESLVLNLAQATSLFSRLDSSVHGYGVVDSATAIQDAFGTLSEPVLMTAGSVEVELAQPRRPCRSAEYAALEATGSIVDTKDFAVVDNATEIDQGGISFDGPASVTALVGGDQDLTGLDNLEANATDLDVNGYHVDLTVAQVKALSINLAGGSFDVDDGAQEIVSNIAAIDGADEIFSSDPLTLTVAEQKALDDEDTTLAADYRIKDSAQNIMNEIQVSAAGEGSAGAGDQAGYDQDLGDGTDNFMLTRIMVTSMTRRPLWWTCSRSRWFLRSYSAKYCPPRPSPSTLSPPPRTGS